MSFTFEDIEEILEFLGEDATLAEAWEVVRLQEYYDQIIF